MTRKKYGDEWFSDMMVMPKEVLVNALMTASKKIDAAERLCRLMIVALWVLFIGALGAHGAFMVRLCFHIGDSILMFLGAVLSGLIVIFCVRTIYIHAMYIIEGDSGFHK